MRTRCLCVARSGLQQASLTCHLTLRAKTAAMTSENNNSKTYPLPLALPSPPSNIQLATAPHTVTNMSHRFMLAPTADLQYNIELNDQSKSMTHMWHACDTHGKIQIWDMVGVAHDKRSANH